MKTTLDIPDQLMRTVKIRAVRENKKLKEMIAELLARGLAGHEAGSEVVRRRVELPLVQCAHAAREGEEMTPDRVARILSEQEADAAHQAAR